MTADTLALWLAVETDDRVDAMVDLVESGDLLIVSDGNHFALVPGHTDMATRFEIGPLPMMAPGVA